MNLLRILSWRPGAYLRASGELLGWLLLRALAQVLTVLLLARLLGAEGYGLFVTILAVSGFFVPLAGLGLHGILLCDGARNPAALPKLIGSILALWWPSTLVFSVVAFLSATWALPPSLPLVLVAAFTFSEIVSSSFVELAGRIEQSQRRMREFGALNAGLAVSRLTGLLIHIAFFPADPTWWICIYAITSLAYTGAVASWIKVRHRPIPPKAREWRLVGGGFPFTVGAISLRLQGEYNKPVLAQIGYTQVANFSAAQRVIDLASLPLMAMQETLWPRYYATDEAPNRVWIVSLFLIFMALLAGMLLSLAAPMLPRILGTGFESSAILMVALAWMPTLQVVRNLMTAAVIANRRQSFLIWVYLSSGTTSIILNSILVPQLGLPGAVWAGYLGEILSILMLLVHHVRYRKVHYVH